MESAENEIADEGPDGFGEAPRIGPCIGGPADGLVVEASPGVFYYETPRIMGKDNDETRFIESVAVAVRHPYFLASIAGQDVWLDAAFVQMPDDELLRHLISGYRVVPVGNATG